MKKYVYTNGYMLNGTKDMVATKTNIYIENDKIVNISNEILEGYEQIDISNKYIMPGLINMHVHLAGNGKPQKKQRDNEKLVNTIFATAIGRYAAKKLVEQYAKIELMSGVTTIRTVGGLKKLDTQTRNKINEGKLIGPRILASNTAISVPHGHMAGSVAKACTSTQEALNFIDELKNQDVDLIKLMITGGVMDAKEKGVPGEMKMPVEMIRACCDKAHKMGYIVSAHTESTEGVRIALENGVDSIEHGAILDDECIQLFKKNNAFLICTISPGIPYAKFDRSVANTTEVEKYNGEFVLHGFIEGTKAAIENDIPIGLGNDVGCPWISQYDFFRELVYFHKYIGVSNQFALHTATLNNAKLAGIDDITGSIEIGKSADMIITKENPLDDLNALRNIDTVIIKGHIINNPKIKRNKYVDSYLDPYMK